MVCKGLMGKNSLETEFRIVNSEGKEIYNCYRNKFAPLKLMITGCSGKNNYIGETRHLDTGTEFVISENEETLLRVKKVAAIGPKCLIDNIDRDLNVKFSIGLGNVKTSIMENDSELAVMTIRRKEYTLEIEDDENPTLMTAIMMGAAEVNGFTGELKD